MKLSELLLEPTSRAVVSDRGITWVTDRYVIVRADLFTGTVKPRDMVKVKPTVIRGVLTLARDCRSPQNAQPTGWRMKGDGGQEDAVLIRDSAGAVLVNERVWRGMWTAGALPRIAVKGQVSWWQERRGKRVLVGVLMPVRISDYRCHWESSHS